MIRGGSYGKGPRITRKGIPAKLGACLGWTERMSTQRGELTDRLDTEAGDPETQGDEEVEDDRLRLATGRPDRAPHGAVCWTPLRSLRFRPRSAREGSGSLQ
jgi:hypothetical protein